MRVGVRILGGVASLVLAGAGGRFAAAQALPPRPAIVARVEDGRTVWLDAAGAAPFKARLAWIAVPAAPAGKSAGEPHGVEARQHLEVWKGQAVEFLRVGAAPDGTPLVEVLWRPTGESVVTLNYEMVRSGYARAACVLSGAYALQCRVLRRAQDVAQEEHRGLWAPRP